MYEIVTEDWVRLVIPKKYRKLVETYCQWSHVNGWWADSEAKLWLQLPGVVVA